MAEPAVAPQPIELKLATGEVIKAPTYEEALKIAVKMAEDTKTVYQQEKQARENLEQRMAAIEARNAAAAQPKPNGNGYSQEKYFQLLNEDAMAAADYLDAHRFGIGDPSQVRPTFLKMQTDISQTRQEAMAAQFIQQHYEDFPQTPEAAKDLRMRFENLMSEGYPATLDTLNMAYSRAVSDGTIKPIEQKAEPERQEANPSLAGSGAQGITDEEASKIDRMSDSELEAYMKQKGLL